ncbi:MAG: SipW-dependent-type signal peptide-containing protein [Marvinbryantia sp.]|jgi:predicted ribosomally synthesized peptide with SipW-like signal peptide
MKQLIALMLITALVLGVGAGVTHAYLTADDSAVNRLQVSGVEISVRENFQPPKTFRPGVKIKKAPQVVSSSDTDCYVRMAVYFSDGQAENFCEPLSVCEGWQAGDDGYYYWQEKVAPGQMTAPLFEMVQIRADAEKIQPFDILVYAEAVQCGSLSAQDAWETMKA